MLYFCTCYMLRYNTCKVKEDICVFGGINVEKYHWLKHIRKINMVLEGAYQDGNWYKEGRWIQVVEGGKP